MARRGVGLWDAEAVAGQRPDGGQGLIAQARLAVGQVDQAVGRAGIVGIDDLGATPRRAGAVQDEIGALPRGENHPAVLGCMRLDRLAVEGDDGRRMPAELQREDPSIRRVDQAQAQPLARRHLDAIGHAPIDRDGVAEPAGMGDIVRIAPVLDQLRLSIEPPVGKQPDQVAIDRRRIGLLDHEGAAEAAPDLPAALHMRVVPVGPRIRHREVIEKARAGIDRCLGDVGDAVHRIRQANSVPVNGGRLIQPVGALQHRHPARPYVRVARSALTRPGPVQTACGRRSRDRLPENPNPPN